MDLATSRYKWGGNLVVRLVDQQGPYWTVSVNVPGTPLGPDELTFKTYAENRGLYEQFLGAAVIEPTGPAVPVERAGPQPVCRLK